MIEIKEQSKAFLFSIFTDVEKITGIIQEIRNSKEID